MEIPVKDQEESVSLVEDYLGIGKRTLYILLAITACALVATTGIYIGIYGFRHWRTNMNRATEAMVINFNAPTTAPAAAQYVCPNCQVTVAPVWSPNTAPVCPICGARLNVR